MECTTTGGRLAAAPRLQRVLRWAAVAAMGVFLTAAPLVGLVAPPAQADGSAQAAGPAPAALPGSTVSVLAGKNLTSIEIDDTADGTGILNKAKLEAALRDINFNEPTKVAVYTRTGLFDDNINTETLKRARAKHPDWISSSDTDKWADGYFIISLTVQKDGHGQIGTFFGEDRKISQSDQTKIQDAGKDNFRAAVWTDGIVDVAKAGAEIMNRPWYRSPAFLGTVGVGGGAIAVGAGGIAAFRARNRSKAGSAIEEGTTALASVTMNLDNTEISARALPATGSKHAADLESRFQAFMITYRELVQVQDRLQSSTKKERSASGLRTEAESFASRAKDLDALDDTITAAAALYARTATWRDAWQLQIAPLQADLAGVPAIVNEADNMKFGLFDMAGRGTAMDAAAMSLKSWLVGAQQRFQELNTEMEAGSLDTDAALDRLKQQREELSNQLQSFAQTQIQIFAKNQAEQEAMEREMAKSRMYTRSPGSILDTVLPAFFWSSSGYSQGFTAGVQSVQSSRSSASSGTTTGYSGGGGSFSGAGSSSRF